MQSTDFDDFNLICHIGFDKKLISRAERVNNVMHRDYLGQYKEMPRQILLDLLNKYQNGDLKELADTKILELSPFRKVGIKKIM